MEVASLSVGAVALASLFKTCVECFDYVEAAKSCGRDLALLKTRFRLEGARLVIWGESVGLDSADAPVYDKIESPRFQALIQDSLNCICHLFEDTTALSARYGLTSTSHETALSVLGSSLSPTNPVPFRTSYLRFKSHIQQNNNGTGVSNKVRWAIRDKQIFACLVDEIHTFIDGLESLTHSAEIAAKRVTLIQEELNSLEDPEHLRLIIEASEADNEEWCDAASVALGTSAAGSSQNRRIKDWLSAVSIASIQYEDSITVIRSAKAFSEADYSLQNQWWMSCYAGLKLARTLSILGIKLFSQRILESCAGTDLKKGKTVYRIDSVTDLLIFYINLPRPFVYRIELDPISSLDTIPNPNTIPNPHTIRFWLDGWFSFHFFLARISIPSL
ncbi:MAG: hypothetical protein Q9169_008232 [Polycauliona sp. 2 TL-2023]